MILRISAVKSMKVNSGYWVWQESNAVGNGVTSKPIVVSIGITAFSDTLPTQDISWTATIFLLLFCTNILVIFYFAYMVKLPEFLPLKIAHVFLNRKNSLRSDRFAFLYGKLSRFSKRCRNVCQFYPISFIDLKLRPYGVSDKVGQTIILLFRCKYRK